MQPNTATIVLLRGLARSSGHWGEFAPSLERQGFRLLTPETAGNGHRYHELSPIQISLYVDDLQAKMKSTLNHIKPLLVGISMGGMIAAEWAKLEPSKFSGLVLINSSFGRFSPPWKRLRPSALKFLFRAGQFGSNRARERAVLDLISNKPERRSQYIEEFTSLAREFPVAFTSFVGQIGASATYGGPTKKPPLPTLILGSDGDRMVHPDCSRDIAKHWESEIAMHPTAGHDLPLDEPLWTTEKISHFASEIGLLKK